MSKGGGNKKTKQTQDFKLPAWYETAAKDLIAAGKNVASGGYIPYIGPDVAAMSPETQAGIDGTNAMSAAFGMPTSGGGYLPAAQTTAGGVKGYSSFPGFEESMANLKAKYPAAYEFISSFNKYGQNSPALAQSFNPSQVTPMQSRLDPNFNKIASMITLSGLGGGGGGFDRSGSGGSKGPFKPA